MPSFPVALENCPVLGWSEQPLDNVIQFDTELGAPKRRRRSSDRSILINVQFELSHTDYAIFTNFYRNDIKDGALSFDWKHPITQVVMKTFFEGPPSLSQQAPKSYILSCDFRIM